MLFSERPAFLRSIDRAQVRIELALEGRILHANALALALFR
ncbi:hypothetical protein [Methylobacterium planeticum]|nr:hypothetical protein [Methylobacterium planeticum]